VLRREVLHGEPWAVTPTRVVVDEPDLLAVFIAPGTEFGFPEHHWPHEWQLKGNTRWRGHGKLMMHRPGDAYSVDLFWKGEERCFAGWYLNLQDPFRRTPQGFDTLDHDLDYWLPAVGDWVEKDREVFERQVGLGKFTSEQAESIREQGRRIRALLTAGDTWWDQAWARWQPDPSWTAAELPEGWADYLVP
jgi:hypothetical protein